MLQTATKVTTLCSVATFKQWLNVTSNKTKAITSLTSVGTVATAVCAGHGYATNNLAVIAGAVPAGYVGSFLITVVDPNTFTFNLPAATTSPATGTPTVTPDDGRYAEMADAATAKLEQAIGVLFVKRSVTEVFSGDGKIAHALNNSPVVSIDSFTIDGSTVDPSTYVFDAETGIITFTGATTSAPGFATSGGFSEGTKNVAVTYTTGYDVQDGLALPADIVEAGLNWAKAIHDELVSNAVAAATVSLGPSSMVIRAAKVPQSVQAVIDGWAGAGMRVS